MLCIIINEHNAQCAHNVRSILFCSLMTSLSYALPPALLDDQWEGV
jgi:hypothetical protein